MGQGFCFSLRDNTFFGITTILSSPFFRMNRTLKIPRKKSYPARSHKAVLRHAVAKHDPNAGRRDVLLLCDRTYSRKHNNKINNRRKHEFTF